MSGLIPPLTGLQNSLAQFNQAASTIARAALPASNSPDIVDLSAAAVALLQSRNSFEANTKVVKAVDQMDQALLNMIG